MKNISTLGTGALVNGNDEEEICAIALYQAREEEIEKKKMQVKEKVECQLGRAEKETRRLAQVWEDIELLTDPMRKDLTIVRKKIDISTRKLRSMRQSCQKKENEYREAMEALHQKSDEKKRLTIILAELVKESEKVRMKKLEELNKILDPSG
ncbi:hypothetical protein L2E82_07615 [Cichorium intybus]|uniref:Uncharacterized protein n=1 Tax=Cichorium intybus TaxID=13427 RepID=A0ACB9G450_CICIN|nr:hypothetical protein L2E82_07615 [Cichorium intybus]